MLIEEGAEVLLHAPIARRGKAMVHALADTAPPHSQVTRAYAGRHRRLVLYGVGLPERMRIRAQHLQRGGHVVMWDLGYWDRDDHMRLAIDALHPTAEQIAAAPAQGCRRAHTLRDDADPQGPVLLVGMGDKSAAMLGLQPGQWEAAAMRRIRSALPGRRVLWRPKKRASAPCPLSAEPAPDVPIEKLLRGTALVVCRHSNVAVDACVAGVPVRCDEGAAQALYADEPSPTRAQRGEFLRRLGWWNWAPAEAAQAWAWIEERTA